MQAQSSISLLGDDRLPPRFWSKVRVSSTPTYRLDLGPCWLWTAAKRSNGYGAWSVGTRSEGMAQAHRFAYEGLVSSVPHGLELDHLCRNRACVNIAHLEPVTHAENQRRSPLAGKASRAKTHCPQGHPYDERNTRRYKGRRHCRACARERARRIAKHT